MAKLNPLNWYANQLEKIRIRKLEAEIPLTLRTAGLLLNMGINFNRAVQILGREKSEIGKEFRKISEEAEKGESIRILFSRFAERTNSNLIKRAISQLISVYEHGGKGNEVIRMADELLSIQKHKIEEYTNKSALFGLLFIITSIVLPTFLLIFSTIGKMGFSNPIDQTSFFLMFLVLLPCLSLLILLISKSQAPFSMLKNEEKLNLLPILIGIIVFIGILFNLELIFLGILLILVAYLNYKEYKKEKELEEIENNLPDALLRVSSLPKGGKPEKLFEIIKNSNYGFLSKEFEKSYKQLKANVKIERVLGDLGIRRKSPLLNRVSKILKYVFETNSFQLLHELAEDILAFFEIRRKRASIMGIQKYTLIAGAFLIPIILGTSLQLIKTLESFSSNSEMFDSIYSAIPIYLIIYSLLCSYYISEIEEYRSHAIRYSFLMMVAGISVFYLMMGV